MKPHPPDGLLRGPRRYRGEVLARRVGHWPFHHWEYSVCVGGTAWTKVRTCRRKAQVAKEADRLLRVTPNRENRRQLGAVRRKR